MTDAAFVFDHASKVYDSHVVLDDAVLSIAPGETLALVGHNGAGKTTMMKLLLGLIRPTTGAVRVLGLNPAGPDGAEAKRTLGFLPETVAFQQAMTGIEVLNFYARLKGANLADNAAMLEKVGLGDAASRRVKTYSKGMRQRLGLAQALLGNPRLMLLDEPTSGLDPATRRQFYDTISALRDDGVTVLMSSHALSEFESHVDRIAIMGAGRLKASGTLAELRHDADIPVHIQLRTRDTAADIAARLGGATITRVNGHMVELTCTPGDKMDMVRRVTDMGGTIEDIEINLPSLDQLYRHYRNGDDTP